MANTARPSELFYAVPVQWHLELNPTSGMAKSGSMERKGSRSHDVGLTAFNPLFGRHSRHRIGFWNSTDGGVSWTNYRVAPGGERQGIYPPVVNLCDPNH